MKKLTLIAVAVLLINSAFGQKKDTVTADIKNVQADSTVQLTMALNDFRAVLTEIDRNIDSKTVTTRLIQFLQRSARLLEAEKPKPTVEQRPKQ